MSNTSTDSRTTVSYCCGGVVTLLHCCQLTGNSRSQELNWLGQQLALALLLAANLSLLCHSITSQTTAMSIVVWNHAYCH